MKLIIDIDKEKYNKFMYSDDIDVEELDEAFEYLTNGTPIPDNATNGDVIKAMFGDNKVSEFMCHTRIIAKVGNWFNEGVVAEFNNVWLNAPYQKGGKK